jgi:SpoVK/Ycf46/Vps4 family AAA+-type ATPase
MGVGADIVEGSLTASHIRDAATSLEERDGALILTGSFELPALLRHVAATVDLPAPAKEEFRDLLEQIIRDTTGRQHVEVTLSQDERDTLLQHLSGLTLMEAEKVLTKAIVEDGRLTVDDIRHVIDAKKEIVEREGLLEYYPVEATMAGVADLETLKEWLAKRKYVVEAPERAQEYGLDFPKGVLLLGVPGCGKSLSAKAVASEWRLPLLKLDPSNLYNKYIGESERNFKRAMKAAESMAPVVLWIDEIEKAFATSRSGSEDGGVSRRILGSFLSWLQDRTGDVFVVATANDIQSLPPEFLRKGRFDEIFFVDLPDQATRAEIFRIHLAARKQDAADFDLTALAAATDGFSGSEIEEVVVSALYTVFSGSGVLSGDVLGEEVTRTRPLSVTMAEHIRGMRAWAEGRTVRAN